MNSSEILSLDSDELKSSLNDSSSDVIVEALKVSGISLFLNKNSAFKLMN